MSITQEQWNKTNALMSALVQNTEEELFTIWPIWMRLHVLASKLSNGIDNGLVDSDINWDKINDFLAQNTDPYDFNCFGKITYTKELFDVAANSKIASIMGAWQKHNCKECGQEFFMEFSEVEFYRNKELCIPKRCKCCRTKTKRIKDS